MNRTVLKVMKASILCATLFALGNSHADEIVGTFVLSEGVPLVMADQAYLLTGSTQLFDQDGNRMALDQIFPGRLMELESATGLEGSGRPVATRVIVLEPH